MSGIRAEGLLAAFAVWAVIMVPSAAFGGYSPEAAAELAPPDGIHVTVKRSV